MRVEPSLAEARRGAEPRRRASRLGPKGGAPWAERSASAPRASPGPRAMHLREFQPRRRVASNRAHVETRACHEVLGFLGLSRLVRGGQTFRRNDSFFKHMRALRSEKYNQETQF